MFISKKRKKEIKNNSRNEVKVARPKKVCFFCENKLKPNYVDSVTLRRFLSDRAKIHPKQRTGACSKHQRLISKEIKYARHLSLLPFVASA